MKWIWLDANWLWSHLSTFYQHKFIISVLFDVTFIDVLFYIEWVLCSFHLWYDGKQYESLLLQKHHKTSTGQIIFIRNDIQAVKLYTHERQNLMFYPKLDVKCDPIQFGKN